MRPVQGLPRLESERLQVLEVCCVRRDGGRGFGGIEVEVTARPGEQNVSLNGTNTSTGVC